MADEDFTLRLEAGKRLRYARELAGFKSQLSACTAMGWHQSSYNSHEAGVRKLNDENARKYGAAYGVDPSWLMFGKGERPTAISFSAMAGTKPQAQAANGVAVAQTIPLFTAGADGELSRDGDAPGFGKSAFAVYALDGLMAPKIMQGDTVIVDPAKPARIGDDVLVIVAGAAPVIRRFKSQAGGDIHLGNLVNEDVQVLPASGVKTHRVVAILMG